MIVSKLPMFRVFLQGENFLIKHQGSAQKFGFFVTRFVEAESEGEAKERTIKEVWAELLAKGGTLNSAKDSPRVEVDRIEEMEASERPAEDPGFVWYPAEGS